MALFLPPAKKFEPPPSPFMFGLCLIPTVNKSGLKLNNNAISDDFLIKLSILRPPVEKP